MRCRKWGLLLLALLTSRASAAAQGRCEVARTALVLSGGGAKGLAHVGVIRALERVGIRPDLIVGSSMGAVVGALAASGYTAAEIDSIARTLPLGEVFHAVEPRGPVAWGARLPLLLWAEGDHGFAIQTATVDQRAISGMLNDVLLRGNLLARGDFDRLPIPLRVVATNMADRGVRAFASGDLAQAVRGSIAIPLIFTPEVIGDSVYADGGLSANIPIAVARHAGATRVIVSDVTEEPSDTLDLTSPIVVADRLLNWLFRQPADSLGAHDLRIRSPIGDFRSLDFTPRAINRLIAVGATAAEEALATWPCWDTLSIPSAPRIALPRILAIERGGESAREGIIVQRALALERPRAFDLTTLAADLRELTEREVFREIWLSPTSRGDTVVLRPTLRRLPRRVAGVGLSYDAELGGRLWVGVLDRHLPAVGLEGSALLTTNRYENDLRLELRRETRFGQSNFTPMIVARGSDLETRRFLESGLELPTIETAEVAAEAGVERQLALGFRIRMTGLGHSWRIQDPVLESETVRSTVGASLLIQKLTLAREELARAEFVATGTYLKAALDLRFRGAMAGFRIEPRFRFGVGRNLPPHERFTLGGTDGFPGFHLGERPGDNEIMAGLALQRRLLGPVSLRLAAAAGRTALLASELLTNGVPVPGFSPEGSLFGESGWLGGARIGLGSDTPIGPIRLEYGFNSASRSTVYFRVGRW